LVATKLLTSNQGVQLTAYSLCSCVAAALSAVVLGLAHVFLLLSFVMVRFDVSLWVDEGEQK
jgi:hypothetical protein